jgi:hypothetical protein
MALTAPPKLGADIMLVPECRSILVSIPTLFNVFGVIAWRSASACPDFDANIVIAGLDPAIHLPEESF